MSHPRGSGACAVRTHLSVGLGTAALLASVAGGAIVSVSGGDGTFAPGVDMNVPTHGHPLAQFGDFDGDGDVDFFSAWGDNPRGGGIVVYAREGESWELRTELSTRSAFFTDMNGDGIIDILFLLEGPLRTIGWYELTANLTTSEFHRIDTTRNYATSLSAGDLDGDGQLDVLDGASGSWFTYVAGDWASHALPTSNLYSVEPCDIDGDGDQDVSVQHEGPLDTREIDWFENLGGNPPAFLWHHVASRSGVNYPRVLRLILRAVDLNGDGDDELLWNGGDHWEWADNTGPEPTVWTVNRGPGFQSDIGDIEVADLDQDGDVDVVTASREDGKIAWFENLGGDVPEFAEHPLTSDGTNVFPGRAVTVGDIDLDSDLDIVGFGLQRTLLFENLIRSVP